MKALALFVLPILALACDAAERSAGSSSAAVSSPPRQSASAELKASASTPASAKPADSASLTAESLTKAGSTVKVGDDFNKSVATLTASLGKPTTEGAERRTWGISSKNECGYLMIKESEGKVSEVTPFASYPRDKRAEFDDCFLYLDRTPADKDENAAGPTEGKVYAVGEVLDGIDAARSKWAGKKVRVRGRVLSSVKSGPSLDELTIASMSVADEKDEQRRVAVQVTEDVKSAPEDGKTAGTSLSQRKVIVTAEGTVAARGQSIDKARIVK